MKTHLNLNGNHPLRSYFCNFARMFAIAGSLSLVVKAQAAIDPSNDYYGPTNVPLDSWSFYDDTNWTSDYGYAPVSYTNLDYSYLGNFHSLVIDTNLQAFLQYNVFENDGSTNLTLENGSVTFWFAPGSWSSTNLGGTGPGDWGRLLEVGDYTPDSSYGWWSIFVDPDGANLYFAGQTNDLSSNVTVYASSPIAWTTNFFHFIAISYTATNTILYLDGAWVTNGPGITAYPGQDVLTNGFWIGASSNGFNQAHGLYNTIQTYDYPLNSNDVQTLYEWYYPNYLISPFNTVMNSSTDLSSYGTNLSLSPVTVSNNFASLFVVNSGADILYEIQSTTNLANPNWISEGFVNGSELTNFTTAHVIVAKTGAIFLRIRSWIDTTGTGIPDWWWLKYYGQTTNVDAYAEDSAGDGYNNMDKFEMNLAPNVYYTSNAPTGFYGCFDGSGTNVVLGWDASPGPVTGYIIQRGVYNTNTSSYDYTQYPVSSNATFLKLIGASSDVNSQQDTYTLQTAYPNGGLSPMTGAWHVGWFSGLGHFGLPYGPPVPGNVYAHVDAGGTNVLLSWNPAGATATNYILLRGVLDTNTYAYAYAQIATVSSNTFSYQDASTINDDNAWNDIYQVEAVYPGDGRSTAIATGADYPHRYIHIGGNTNSPAAPGNFFGYTDSTGTNIFLSWSAAPGSPVNCIVYGGVYNYITSQFAYHQLGSGASSFEVVGAFDDYGIDRYDIYGVVAVYSDGSVSREATWYPTSGAPAPAELDAYLDETGTNVLLNWTAAPGPVTGYIISQSLDSGGYFSQVDQVGSSTLSYQHTDGAPFYEDISTMQYQVQATYANGGLSAPVTAQVNSTPPAPTDVAATVDGTGANVSITWTPSLGAVSSYVILRGTYNSNTGSYDYSQIASVDASTTSYTDTGAITGGGNNNYVYQVKAIYQNGTVSQLSTQALHIAQTITNNLSVAAQLVRNETGRWQLMFTAIPTNVTSVQVYIAPYYFESDGYWGSYTDPTGYFDNQNLVAVVPVTNLVNGVYVIPDSIATNEIGDNFAGRLVGVQAIGSSERVGQMAFAGFFPYDAPCFIDGREHLKQNLLFQFRAATVTQPKSISYDHVWFDPGYIALTIPTDTNYVESSFFHWAAMFKSYDTYEPEYVEMDDLWPITANYQYHQSLYDTNFSGPSEFVWPTNLVSVPASAVLGISGPYWTSQFLGNLAEVAADTNGDNLYLQSGYNNLYGLPFETALVNLGGPYYNYDTGTWETNPIITLDPGNSTALTNVNVFYSQTDDPNLQLDNYYFATVNTPGTALPGDNTPVQASPLPCLTGFASTNQTGLLVASVGNPTVIGSWAKFGLQNGSSSKFAYLGQYFVTNAFKLDGSGNVTTNTTGVVSPYGNFFPTEPGAAALITQPDIDNGTQGTGIVRVVSLNVDGNHDGTMDFTYQGPDFVSASKPFRFWINDDIDSGDEGGDGVPGQSGIGDAVRPVAGTDYRGFTLNAVHGTRDLVDFFPVYLNIGSLVQALPPSDNVRYVLKQADSAVNFTYTDLTPTNYMNFLRDTNEASALAASNTMILAPDGYILDNKFIQSIATNNQGIILVEGRKATTQPLVLEVWQGNSLGSDPFLFEPTNMLVQTKLYLSLSGVEQMFRHKNLLLDENPAMPDRLTDADVPNEPDTIDKNFVFIHGYNVNPQEARGNAADVFKRMYWSGSHARFWAVTWEGSDTKELAHNAITPDYNINVEHAFDTAPLLANFITTLTNTGPVAVTAHSLGNMLTLSAIHDHSAPVSQYFMLDAAVPLEAIDADDVPMTTNMVFSSWQIYTNRLYDSDWYQFWPANDGRSTLTWSNRLADFHNVQVYNFYSSGEEVLREYDADPPLDVLSSVDLLKNYFQNHSPLASFVWVFQEKGKGQSFSDLVLGSTHGGWKFSTNYDGLTVAQANALPSSQLETNAFFDFTSSSFFYDAALYETYGSTYAQTNRNRILSDAIPALTLPVGANPVPSLSPSGQPTRNFDMQQLYENGWPLGRLESAELNKWHHSDFHQVAYTFTYNLFDALVILGNLK